MPRVPRAAVEMRAACSDDLDALVALYQELGSPQTALLRRGRAVTDPRDGDAPRRGLARALEDPSRRVVVACSEGVPVGFVLLALVPASALLADLSVRAEPLVVARRARRHGVGRALLAAAAAFGEQHGAAMLTIALRPNDRDGNRYFARLGFVPAEMRRVAPIASVRRALGGPLDPVRSLDGAARRRRLRAREIAPPRGGVV